MSKLDTEIIDWIRGKNGIHRGSGTLLRRMFGDYKGISNWKNRIARLRTSVQIKRNYGFFTQY